MTTQQPEALRLAEMLTADEWPGHVTLVSYAQECVAELRRQHARITELESQLAQRFDAADMATAAAQGFREGATAPAQPVAAPAAQQGVAYAALPTSSYAGRVYEEGFLIGTCPLYTADQLHAFADATHTLRASHGQAQAETGNSVSAQADNVQEDAARLDFLIEQRAYVVSDPDACPGYWLHWARPDGRTWVQVDEHPTPRAAIDAARKQGEKQ